jgi:hypothetical protein
MRKPLAILVLLAAACMVCAEGESTWTVKSMRFGGASNAVAQTGTARLFTGQLEALHVYLPTGMTGDVWVTLAAPYGGPSMLLATNGGHTGHAMFLPRVTYVGESPGAVTMVLTNDLASPRIPIAGETLVGTLANASTSNAPALFRAVYIYD